MVLLKNEELITKTGDLMGKSHPTATRIEALRLCQVFLVRFVSTEFGGWIIWHMYYACFFPRKRDLKWLCCIQRSSRGCDQLMTAHCQPIVQGITNAMSEIHEKTLVREGCRTALLALRYSGNHHRCFWSNAIDEVLYKILSGSCTSSHHAHQTLCHGELFMLPSLWRVGRWKYCFLLWSRSIV